MSTCHMQHFFVSNVVFLHAVPLKCRNKISVGNIHRRISFLCASSVCEQQVGDCCQMSHHTGHIFPLLGSLCVPTWCDVEDSSCARMFGRISCILMSLLCCWFCAHDSYVLYILFCSEKFWHICCMFSLKYLNSSSSESRVSVSHKTPNFCTKKKYASFLLNKITEGVGDVYLLWKWEMKDSVCTILVALCFKS